MFTTTALAQVTEEWVARYNGPGNDYDSANDIAVDQSGNVYVTGASTGFFYDYATIKYDANGNQLWVSRYNGPGNGHDLAVALRVDAVGNVYVTGYSPGSGTSDDYATIKYDTNGSQQWVSRYNGPGSGNDNANALAIDAAGNVYVSGSSYGTSNDYAIIKYDTNGNQQWVSRYNGPGNGNDNAYALAIDAVGNVYVTGYSPGSGTSNDYATIKYDTNGNQQWVSRYNGPGNYADYAGAIAIDVTGNVYVTGASDWDYSSNLANYATIKYDPGGNQLWVAIYDGPANDTDAANNILVDSSGNVYVTGYSYGVVTSMDYATIKYDTNGNQLWVARYDGPSSYLDGASGLALDADSNVYVTGYVYGPGPTDYATVKYDTNGNQLWAVHYNSPACCGDDYATAIALDTQNNVYVTGTSFAPTTLYGYYDYSTIKYSQPPPAELPRTGQTTCYDSAGAVIACAGTGQDGEIQAGVPWPDPRFTDNADGTVTDNLTGLMWTKDGNAPGPAACSPATTKTWQDALDYVACLNTNSYLGYTDWRLPNVLELETLANAEQPDSVVWLNTHAFSNVQSGVYWSSTSSAYNPSSAWDSYIGRNYTAAHPKSYSLYVWPVRSEQNTPPEDIWKTGQTACYDSAGAVISCAGTGQDGEIQAGVPWPSPRFTDNSDGTATDNLTGLMWTKDGNAPGPAACSPTTTKTWQGALDYVSCLNINAYLGYTDWRLPNWKEFHSLTDFSRNSPSLPLGHPFLNVQWDVYWSSTSSADYPNSAFHVVMWLGYVTYNAKFYSMYVWPVRSGQVGAIGSTEICDGIDNDLDGFVDEGFTDTDSDGQADCVDSDDDNDGYTDTAEIAAGSDPLNAASTPEVCDGVDNDLDGQTDEGLLNTYYRDADGDGYGNALVTTQACAQPSGYVLNSSDCNDGNASIKPGATEVCNGVDDNCNSQIDEGVKNTYYQDADNDTYGNESVTTQACTLPSGYVSTSTDCNDGNASIKPNATEVCNTIDDNCNGQVDEGCPGVEVCDGIDNDGDSLIDEDFPAGNTTCGSDVQVTPDGVTTTFPSVTMSGDTTVTTSGTGQPPPSGFKLGATPTYYEIASTATFSGTVEVCINYDETQFATERSLKLFHWEGSWKDITASLDTTANVICGNTTSFSPFIVAESSASPTAITLQNFSANLDGGHVVLTWSTSFERDNEGFHIQRGESVSGPFVTITPSMIPAMDGPGMKAAYTFTDSGVESGKTYYYRLQDVDSRGKVTTQRVVSVNTAVAGGERSSQEGTSQKTGMVSASDQKEQTAGRNSVQDQISSAGKSTPWTSVVVESNPLTLTLSPEGRSDKEGGSVVVPPTPTLPHKGGGSEENGRDAKEEYSDAQPSAATTGVVALQTHHNPGPSSFSVSIEDDKGNIILVSRVEDTESKAAKSSDLKVTEESDRVVLTWQGRSGVKGFILHRTEKGKDNYTPVSNLIPYFGRDDKDVYLYQFTDNSVKPGARYDYRLERVEAERKIGHAAIQ